MECKSISSGSHRELLETINQLGLTKEQIVSIVALKDMLIAYYYA